MKPIKTFSSIAIWFLRISIMMFMIAMYGSIFQTVDLDHLNINILIAFIYCLFGLLLFIGGFQKNATLTVLSAMLICFISIYYCVIHYKGSFFDFSFMMYIFPISIGLYFVANGNK